MKKWLCLSVFCVLYVQLGFSQKEANIWYFGQHAGLDFNSGSPIVISGKTLQTWAYASISDKNGNLLFYTDGVMVYNNQHNTMLNSAGIGGQQGDINTTIIIPNPNDSSIYYLFYVKNDTSGYKLLYSEVDMNLAGGLGDITSNKNIVVYSSITEQLTAIRNDLTNSYWLVTHKFNSNEFLSFKISNTGIDTSPVTSALGNIINTTVGIMKISPNGKRLAMADSGYPNGYLLLCDFNMATGAISNFKNLNFPAYGVEFSPNSKILYATGYRSESLNQFNIELSNALDIINSRIIFNRLSPTGGYLCDAPLQLAPDGKIYGGCETYYLDAINNPDVLGLGCNFQPDAIYLGNVTGYDLPLFIQSYFRVDDFTFENVCYGDSTNFALNDSVDSVVWDFGDLTTGTNNMSTDLEPTHVFSSPGTYEVSVTATLGTESSTSTSTVVIYEVPVVTPLVELKQCDDDLDGFSPFNLNEVINEITANAGNETITFHESEADANLGTNAITNTTAYTNQSVSSDVVWARVENEHGCFRTSKINLQVTTTQIPDTFAREFHACDNDGNGISVFDFSGINTEIEALFPLGQDLIINYFRDLADALVETNPIADISNYTNTGYPYMQDIYLRVDSKIDNDCIGLGAHIKLYVDPLPEFDVETPVIVCSSDPTFTVILDPYETNSSETYNYEWAYQDGSILSNQPTLTVSTPGTYSVTLFKTVDPYCSKTREIFVNASEIARITLDHITVIDVSVNNTVTINTNNLGQGDYEFTLDDEFSTYQDVPRFENVSAGIHTLYVRDKKGCGTKPIDFSVIGFPKFFTPNGDGFNDTWQIKGVNSQFQAKSDIYIFDRFGKLLKQLATASNGWDGTLDGALLPSDDYWFSVHLQDGREFKGHFALKL